MQQTITIQRHGGHTDDIDADVEGPFAIHETIPVSLGGWTLTHVPTGYVVISTDLELKCKAARADLLASDLDWTFTKPSDVTPAHRMFGRALRRKYEHGL